MEENSWMARDRRHVWHPYTRRCAVEAGELPVITHGEGIHLYDEQGRKYVDAISSWWCCALGHGRPEIISAIRRQSGELQHSILGNLTHPCAIALAGKLADLMPTSARHVLFASDGASAVEQALKIAVQCWHLRGQTQRRRFACIHEAYHGDTLGAMGVGYLEHFHRPFRQLLPESVTLPFPTEANFAPSQRILDQHADELAAVIVEPLCLGAAGMRFYRAEWLQALGTWCRQQGVLLIVDEIAMGFGRTGRTFAFEHAGIDPDMVCLGKALAAGYLPISATVVKDSIYDTFHDQAPDGTLQHGHTFCGNPLAAAAALAALEIYARADFLPAVRARSDLLRRCLAPLQGRNGISDVRTLGLIGAADLMDDAAPLRVRDALHKQGILLRPLGRVVYVMPPLTIAMDELEDLANSFVSAVLSGLTC